MSRDVWDDGATGPRPEAVEGRAKAVWVTPTLTPARVAAETEGGPTAANIERITSPSLKNGS